MENKDSNGKYSKEIESKEQEISTVKHRLMAQGADTFDDELMRKVITNADYSGAVTGRSTPDLSNLASQLNQMYDAYGKQSTYYDGNKNYKIYEIYVTYSNSKKMVFPSSELQQIMFFIIKSMQEVPKQLIGQMKYLIYVSKGVSYILEKYIPNIKYFPYEVFFSSKPDPSQISSPGGAMVLTISIYCHAFQQAQERTSNAIASVLDFSSKKI